MASFGEYLRANIAKEYHELLEVIVDEVEDDSGEWVKIQGDDYYKFFNGMVVASNSTDCITVKKADFLNYIYAAPFARVIESWRDIYTGEAADNLSTRMVALDC